MEQQPTEDSEKKIQVILIIVLVVISVSSVLWLTLISGLLVEQEPTEPVLTTTYSSISPQDAVGLVNSSYNSTIIVDCRTCKCNNNKGHLPNATWNINPEDFYNTTKDLLVYDNHGEKSTQFCQNLTGHVYGAIYCLDGGMDAWKEGTYPVIK